jgi:hypothetical protein
MGTPIEELARAGGRAAKPPRQEKRGARQQKLRQQIPVPVEVVNVYGYRFAETLSRVFASLLFLGCGIASFVVPADISLHCLIWAAMFFWFAFRR